MCCQAWQHMPATSGPLEQPGATPPPQSQAATTRAVNGSIRDPPPAGPCLALPDCTGRLLDQMHMQDGAAAHQLRWHLTICKRTYGPDQRAESSRAVWPCDDLAHSGVSVEWDCAGDGQKDTKDCGRRQQHQGSMEVWPLWARKEPLLKLLCLL